MDALTLQTYVWFFILNLRNDPLQPIESITIDVPTFFKDPTAEGPIIIKNLVINGLETIDIEMNMMDYVNVTKDDPNLELYKVCVKLPVQKININAEYFADIALNNTVPVYGEGNFGLSVTDLKMDFCAMANYDEGYIYDMNLYMIYRNGPITLSGFYKHIEANNIISRILNMANSFFTMWDNYNPLQASCILSPVFEFILNAYIQNSNNVFTFDPTCLKDLPLNFKNDLRLIHEIYSAKNSFQYDSNEVNTILNLLSYIIK